MGNAKFCVRGKPGRQPAPALQVGVYLAQPLLRRFVQRFQGFWARQAIGLQQSPPNMLIISLALFLTYFVMEPVFTEAWINGISPLVEGAIRVGMGPLTVPLAVAQRPALAAIWLVGIVAAHLWRRSGAPA